MVTGLFVLDGMAEESYFICISWIVCLYVDRFVFCVTGGGELLDV